MPWVTLTDSDVLSALNLAEVTRYREIGPDAGADPLTALLVSTQAEVRGYVAAHYDIPSGTLGVPQELQNATLDLVIYRLAKRAQMSSESQRKPAADDARKLLERVAEGKHGLDLTSLSTSGPGAGNWGSEENIFSDN